jgi:hypothetical protein
MLHEGVSSYRNQSDFLVGLEDVPLSASVLHQRGGGTGEVRLRGIECLGKTRDFGKRAKGSTASMVFGRFQVCRSGAAYRGPLRKNSAAGLLHDEKSSPHYARGAVARS